MARSKIKIALGKDIIIRYSARSDNIAESLNEVSIEVHISDYNGNAYIAPFSVEGNTIVARYDGIVQKLLGNYNVRIWFNKGKERQSMVDFNDLFELVKTTEEETISEGCPVYVEAVDAQNEQHSYFDGEGIVFDRNAYYDGEGVIIS